MPRLTDFRVLTFDCYGTLIDWETGIWEALQPVIAHNGGAAVTRGDALRGFSRFEGHHEHETPGLPYPDLLSCVHHDVAGSLGLETDAALDAAFGASVPLWPAFPDSAAALRVLKRHFRLVILSNVHREGIAASARKLGVEFDAFYTAEDIGSYKPSDANFEYLLAHLKSDFGLAPPTSSTPPRASTTTTSPPTASASPAPGSTANANPKAERGAPPPPWTRCPTSPSPSSRSARWRTP